MNAVGQYISYWQIISEAYDSVWREVLYSVVTAFCMPVELDSITGIGSLSFIGVKVAYW
jgi:hypothetical protein